MWDYFRLQIHVLKMDQTESLESIHIAGASNVPLVMRFEHCVNNNRKLLSFKFSRKTNAQKQTQLVSSRGNVFYRIISFEKISPSTAHQSHLRKQGNGTIDRCIIKTFHQNSRAPSMIFFSFLHKSNIKTFKWIEFFPKLIHWPETKKEWQWHP